MNFPARSKPLLCAALLLMAFSSLGLPRLLAQPASGQPATLLLDSSRLAALAAAPEADPYRQRVIGVLTREADATLREGPYSVIDKTLLPPSGDKHDYMSRGPYWWPDPTKPDGLPYIRRDGEHNPEIKKITDETEMDRVAEASRTLALAFYLTHNPAYAEHAALLLRAWFLTPATRMNPNLDFGQGIPGINTGRGTGIIDTHSLLAVPDAAALLAGSRAWTSADASGLKAWFSAYTHWLRTSKNGKEEDAAKNNHGSWYDAQVVDFALFTGDRALAVATLEGVKSRRISEIAPDGQQPLELARTNGWGYSNFNLEALCNLATLGQHAGVDLWNFKTADGRSIRGAIDFLIPYAVDAKPWNFQQIGGFRADQIEMTLERAATAYHDARYAEDARKIRGKRDDLMTLLLEPR